MKEKIIREYKNGDMVIEWRKNGKLHREDGPAVMFYEAGGEHKHEEWWKNGKLHREDGPAVIERNINEGSIVTVEYWYNGKLHRLGGPAIIERNRDGDLIEEEWYCHGNLHREDSPAVIYSTEGGVSEEWWENGVRQVSTGG